MRENEKKAMTDKVNLHPFDTKDSDCIDLDYCKFRLNSLAKKIKSECLNLKNLKFIL